MLFDAAVAAKFTNIASLEELSYSALMWWAPYVKPFARAVKKGEIL
jgi:hypothetical protein